MSKLTEKLTVQEALLILVKALELCNDSRNRLTRFQSTPDFWLREAQEIGEEDVKSTE